ncbi:LPS export ABC transporter periplasmic protein LptC [Rhodobacteraceae bacterium XHP0102]|nr:LPS export ABC transporter periplasmic protein LptC [Rhodobacteraceae bacterium XHP0102]
MIFDNTYSRIIALSKLVLPLAALVVLSLMFLFSGRPDPNQALPLATRNADGQLGQQGMTAPRFAMVTGAGRPVELTASSAAPIADDPDQIIAQDIEAKLFRADQTHDQITADLAEWNSRTSETLLRGNVVGLTPQGYRLDTEELAIDATGGAITAPRNVVITAPDLRLEAGRMEITGPPAQQVVHFQDGVRVLYQGDGGG